MALLNINLLLKIQRTTDIRPMLKVTPLAPLRGARSVTIKNGVRDAGVSLREVEPR